jgi:hypothetical protein
MRSLPFQWGLLATLALLFANACTQSGIIGSDLLEQDQIDVEFTDELPFLAYLQPTDSLKTFDPEGVDRLTGFLCGQFDDPVFGLTQAVINAQFRLNFSNPPDFEGAVLDSMVLILPYRADRCYGDTTMAYDLEVYLLDEDMPDTASLFSNRTFAATQRIGAKSILPRPSDSLEILVHGADTAIGVIPQARIRLDEAFAQELLQEDTLILETDTALIAKYKGIQIRSNNLNKGLLSFNLNSSAAGITVYYRVDTLYRQYTFLFSPAAPRMVSFSQDYSSAPIQAFLQDSTLCDSLVFIQGTSGTGMVLEIPDTDLFSGKIINRAELEIHVANLPEDGAYAFDLPLQLVASIIRDDGSLAIIDEVTIGLLRQEMASIFGGTPQDGMPQVYRMNISSYMKDLKNGNVPNRLLITPLSRAERANRAVFYGPKHSLYPAKINLSLTNY